MNTNPKAKSDHDLLTDLRALVQQEREILTEILHHLHETEVRKLYAKRGHPSLFEFATRELGYSAAAAQRRIEAMRLIRALPEMEDKLRSGELSLSVAAQAQSFFKQEDRRLREAKAKPLSELTKRDIANSLLGKSARDAERVLVELSPQHDLDRRERIQALPLGHTQIQFVADSELFKKLETLKDLLSHKNPSGRFDRLFHEMADIALRKFEKKAGLRLLQLFPTSETEIAESS